MVLVLIYGTAPGPGLQTHTVNDLQYIVSFTPCLLYTSDAADE